MGDEECNGSAGDKKAQREAITDAHLERLVTEKHNLNHEEFPIAHRLLDEELKRTRETGKASFDNRYIDLYNEKPVKLVSRIQFPTKDCPSFNFVGKLLGPKGSTLKSLQETTKCRMFILGKGSMRDKNKEEELRKGGDVKYAHLSDELHVEVSCVAPPSEAHNRMAYALRELQAVLVPDPHMEDGFPSFYEERPMMPRGMRGMMGPMGPPNKAKVMSFLEKARHSMEFQPPAPPRRFGPPRGFQEQSFQRRGDEESGTWVSGYRAGGGSGRGGGFFPKRSTPYART